MEDETARAPLSETPDEEQPEQELVCDTCFNDNLLKAVGIQRCLRCSKIFCIHFGSPVDIKYCVSCMSDISLNVETIYKVYEVYDENNNKIERKRARGTEYKMSGLDWLFAERKIYEMNEAEMEMALEYYTGLVKLILNEREVRKVADRHRFANKKIGRPASPVTVTTTTEVKKTVQTVSSKKKAQFEALFNMLIAQGMTPEQIAKLGKKGS